MINENSAFPLFKQPKLFLQWFSKFLFQSKQRGFNLLQGLIILWINLKDKYGYTKFFKYYT